MLHVKIKCLGQTAELIEEQRKERFSVHVVFREKARKVDVKKFLVCERF